MGLTAPAPDEDELEYVNIMLDYAEPWTDRFAGENQTDFPEYPVESIEDWHKKRGLYNPI